MGPERQRAECLGPCPHRPQSIKSVGGLRGAGAGESGTGTELREPQER